LRVYLWRVCGRLGDSGRSCYYFILYSVVIFLVNEKMLPTDRARVIGYKRVFRPIHIRDLKLYPVVQLDWHMLSFRARVVRVVFGHDSKLTGWGLDDVKLVGVCPRVGQEDVGLATYDDAWYVVARDGVARGVAPGSFFCEIIGSETAFVGFPLCSSDVSYALVVTKFSFFLTIFSFLLTLLLS